MSNNQSMRLGNRIVISRKTLKEMVHQCQVYEKMGFEAIAPYQKRTYYKAEYNEKVTKNHGISSLERYTIYMERKRYE